MRCITLESLDAPMATNQFERNNHTREARAPWLPLHSAEHKYLRMNWTVVSENNGMRALSMNWDVVTDCH